MKKNVASQVIGAQMITAADGSAFTGAVTVAVTGNGGTQATGSVGSGACTHEGNGFHTYAPAQAETNYDHVAFTFTGTGAIPVTVQAYPTFPQTGDSFARLGAPAGASVSADVAAVKTQTAAIEVDTQDLQTQVGVDGAGLTAIPWNASWDAEVQSEATDALNAYDPPTNAEMVARTLAAADYATASALAAAVSLGSSSGAITQSDFTVTSGNTSAPQFLTSIPATITVLPGSGATALVQVSTASEADINTHYNAGAWNGTAVDWFDWTPGSVTEDTYDSITSPIVGLRVTATGGSVDAELVQVDPAESGGGGGGGGAGATAGQRRTISVGSTDQTIYMYIPDPASSDGSGKTGLVAADLTVSYSRVESDNDVTVTDVTSSLSNLAALTTAHTDWGWKEVSSTLQPGVYRLDIADAVLASGATLATVYAMITSSAAAPSRVEIELEVPMSLETDLVPALLSAQVPGDYTAGQLGYVIGTYLDAAISSRADATYWTPTRAGNIDSILSFQENLDLAVADLPTNTELTAALADLPTNGELATALASADDATIAAINSLHNLSAAQVNAEVDAAIETYHLDHLFAASYHPTAKPGVPDALLNELVENDDGVSRFSANTLETAPTGSGEGGSGLDAAGVRAALGMAAANLDTQLAALPTADENADALLARNVAGGSSTGRTVSQAFYFLRNKWTIAGGTLTVYGTDDTTSAWTATITQTSGNPVSSSDPS